MLTVQEYLDKAQELQTRAAQTSRAADARMACARVAANYVRMAELRQRMDEASKK